MILPIPNPKEKFLCYYVTFQTEVIGTGLAVQVSHTFQGKHEGVNQCCGWNCSSVLSSCCSRVHSPSIELSGVASNDEMANADGVCADGAALRERSGYVVYGPIRSERPCSEVKKELTTSVNVRVSNIMRLTKENVVQEWLSRRVDSAH